MTAKGTSIDTAKKEPILVPVIFDDELSSVKDQLRRAHQDAFNLNQQYSVLENHCEWMAILLDEYDPLWRGKMEALQNGSN